MSDIENLIATRAAAMADHDGVAVQIVHIFGAANQLTVELGTARDRLIGKPGLLADTLSDLADAANAEPEEIDPVEAARKAADEAQTAALEAAQRADELIAEADRLQAARDAQEKAEAERLAAEQAAADAAEAERLAAEQAAADAAAAEATAAAKAPAKAASKAK